MDQMGRLGTPAGCRNSEGGGDDLSSSEGISAVGAWHESLRQYWGSICRTTWLIGLGAAILKQYVGIALGLTHVYNSPIVL